MSVTADEIRSQPALWERAGELASSLDDILPAPGEQAAVIGCGTSWFMVQAYAALREGNGHGRTDAFAASEMPLRAYDVVVALSRSGTTTEVAHALMRSSRSRTVAVTSVPDSPVAHAADEVVPLEFADEQSVVQTRFATTALSLLRAHEGLDLRHSIADAVTALDAPLPVEPGEADRWAFLGRGWTVGLASEAALKLRESAQAWTEAYPAFEYRHGPISIAGPGAAVWFFGPPDDGVLEDARAAGALVVAPDLDPLASLVLAQRTGVALAEAAGLDPDRPRNLVSASCDGERVAFAGHALPLPGEFAGTKGEVVLGLRPGSFDLAGPWTDPELSRMEIEAEVVEALGDEALVSFRVDGPAVEVEEVRGDDDGRLLADDPGTRFVARVRRRVDVRTGERLELAVDHRELHLFEVESGRALREAAPADAADAGTATAH